MPPTTEIWIGMIIMHNIRVGQFNFVSCLVTTLLYDPRLEVKLFILTYPSSFSSKDSSCLIVGKFLTNTNIKADEKLGGVRLFWDY